MKQSRSLKRKAELKKLADCDDIIRYNKYHTANLVTKLNPTATITPPASHQTPLTSNNQPPHD
jgi:hypothetical protein